MIVERIEDNIYNRKVWLIIADRKEFSAHMAGVTKKKVYRVGKDQVGGMYSVKTQSEIDPSVMTRHWYIWLTRFDNKIYDIGSLVHECFHCATNILEDLGVDTSDAEGSESLAYYLDFLVRESLSRIISNKGSIEILPDTKAG